MYGFELLDIWLLYIVSNRWIKETKVDNMYSSFLFLFHFFGFAFD